MPLLVPYMPALLLLINTADPILYEITLRDPRTAILQHFKIKLPKFL